MIAGPCPDASFQKCVSGKLQEFQFGELPFIKTKEKKMKIRKTSLLHPVLFGFSLVVAIVTTGCSKKTVIENDNGRELHKFVLPFQTTGLGNPLAAIGYDLKYFEEEGLVSCVN
jgi:hypothetical protein